MPRGAEFHGEVDGELPRAPTGPALPMQPWRRDSDSLPTYPNTWVAGARISPVALGEVGGWTGGQGCAAGG